jgi:uncharacterized cupin superfamily protein
MSQEIMTATPSTVELTAELEPFPPNWVLNGSPAARSKMLARSKDLTTNIVVWECNAGDFHWHYSYDEVIIVVDGEAFLQTGNGERRFGPGDIGFFPAGTSSTWRVPTHIRKVAVLRETMWFPLGYALKAWNKLLRVVGLTGKLATMPANALSRAKAAKTTS